MDEINEKGINDIINYYENKKDDNEAEKEIQKEAEEETPGLVELIEEAQKEKNSLPIVEKISETSDTPDNADISDTEPEKEAGDNPESEISTADTLTEDETDKDGTEKASEENSENKELSESEQQSENKEPSEDEQQSENKEPSENEQQGENTDTEASQESDTEITDDDKSKSELAFAELGDLDYTDYDDKDDYHFSKKQIAVISLVTLIIMAVVVVFVTTDTGVIGSYKHNFSKNAAILLSKIGIEFKNDDTETEKGDVKEAERYNKSVKDTITIPLERAGNSVFSKYKGGIVCANTNYLTFISNSGDIVWENTTTIVDPILKTAGNYILISEKGGKKICLYNDRKLVYEVDTEDNILTCNLSSNGDVVAITDKSSYKGSVVVYNKEGNQIFAWSSGSDNIISADISASSRRVAVGLLNTDAQVKTTMQFFDINKTESYAQVIFEDTILFDIDFAGDTVNAFGDNCIAGVTSSGGVLYDKRFDNAEFVHYGVDEKGNKILLFDDSNIPLINIYSSNASLKHQLSSDEIPDFVDIYGNYILFNSGRDIIYGKSGSRQMAKFTATMDIKALMLLDKNIVAAVYSNSIEIVRM
ncbi:MAG: DUF5711 family protein [Clostridia bacterium]|nr:DUF5711 family protein [Clostridia bacterium]